MIKTKDNYELIRQQIEDRYSNLFIMSKLINDDKYMFAIEYIRFNSINLFFSDEEEIDMGLPELSLYIDNTSMKLQEYLRSKNISFMVRDELSHEDIAIEFQEFNMEYMQIIFDVFDIINDYEDDGIVY
jgi:hypothetical protein